MVEALWYTYKHRPSARPSPQRYWRLPPGRTGLQPEANSLAAAWRFQVQAPAPAVVWSGTQCGGPPLPPEFGTGNMWLKALLYCQPQRDAGNAALRLRRHNPYRFNALIFEPLCGMRPLALLLQS